jgi:uncharacterized protein (TIGR02118 family)
MIKLTFALVRRPEFTREAFQAYWFDHHAPLVASVREDLAILRYVQLHSLPAADSEPLRQSRGAPEPFDGVAQLWWESLEACTRASSTPRGQTAARLLLADEQTFIDHSRSPLWWGEERVVF